MKKITWRRLYYLLRWIASWLFLIILLFAAGCAVRAFFSTKAGFSWNICWFYVKPALGVWLLLVAMVRIAKKLHETSNKNF